MVYVLGSVLASLLEFYLAVLICRLFWKRAEGPRWRTAACLGGYVLLCALRALPALMPVSNLVVYLAVFVVCLNYETQWYWRLFFLPCFALLLAAAELLQSCAAAAVMGLRLSQYAAGFQPDDPIFIAGRVLSLFVAVFLAKLLGVVCKPRQLKEHPHLSLLSLALPLGSCAIVFYFSQAMVYVDTPWVGGLILAVYIVLFAGNLFLIEVVQRTGRVKRAEQVRIAAQEQLQRNTEHYRKLIVRQHAAAQAMQDVRNQLAAGLGLLREGRTEEASALLARVAAGSELRQSSRVSGNVAIDAILDTKRARIEELAISFTLNITMPAACAVAHEDLAVVAGNLLDNAINACQAVAQPDRRYIRFTVKQFQEYLCFQVENSSACQPQAAEPSAWPVHGFGLENVRQAAKKYSGNLSARQDGDRFTVTVLLHNAEWSGA